MPERTPKQKRPPMLRSPWNVVELFVLFLAASFIGELVGALRGEGAQLGLALAELAIGLALSWPVFSGRTFGRWLMGGYLIYYGLATFWLLLEQGTETFSFAYHAPLAAFFAAGGLKLLLTPMKPPAETAAGASDASSDASSGGSEGESSGRSAGASEGGPEGDSGTAPSDDPSRDGQPGNAETADTKSADTKSDDTDRPGRS
ncbi:MAG: hypothetical protein AB7D51_16620 [Desulfovibrionaceae bacterium]